MATTYVDPVCGLEITEQSVGASVEYDEQMYYFCSVDCREVFLADPLHYVENEDEEYGR